MVTESNAMKIGNITAAGSITEFPVSDASGSIVTGSDGSVWLSTHNNAIARITITGTVQYFDFPGWPYAIARGPTGNGSVWVAAGSSAEAVATNGTITAVPLPAPAPAPMGIIRHVENGITAGTDGNLWLTSYGDVCSIDGCHRSFDPTIERMTQSGKVTEFASPDLAGEITTGPDGNLWFTEPGTNRIGQITTSGKITEFEIPTQNSAPSGITSGPDGNVWFTENSANQLGRITMSGAVTEYPIPTANSGLRDITSGPGGTLWFTESNGNKIGRFKP